MRKNLFCRFHKKSLTCNELSYSIHFKEVTILIVIGTMRFFRPTILFLTIALTSLLVFGCGSKELVKSGVSTTTPAEFEREVGPAYDLLQTAEAAYAAGVMHNMKRDWESARVDFDEALRLIAQVDVSEDVDLSARTDLLLREIAYDYRFALAHTDSLEATAAPIVLSVALEDRALSEDTKRRLSELAGDLPMALAGEFDFPVVWNDRVKEKIVFLQTRAREPFTVWMTRSGRYLPMIEEIFASKGLPLDLAYLPLIESGFSPGASSWAHAVGMWQFIKSTGRIFDLEVNWWFDERRDPEKATLAAAEYFTSLYKKFGDWELALAAYNCGDGRMKRSIEKQKTDNYWELDLPTETENYVPLFMAALIIAKNPEAYGFHIIPHEPYEFEIITVDEPTNLDLIAQCTDTTLDFIQKINPEILRYCTAPDATAYSVRVPPGKAEGFAGRYDAIPEVEKTVWAHHKVKKGETLSEIAIHYGTSVGLLVESNKLRSAHRLSIGQELVIPVSSKAARALAAKSATPARGNVVHTRSNSAGKLYTVRKDDTLSEIAENNGVGLEDLLLANGLGRGAVIKPGARLKIPVGKTKTKYTVKSGDTPSTIAARFGVRTEELLNWNDLSSTATIYPGQELIVLASESRREPKGKIIHTIQKGESLWAIARRYNVHVSDLVSWNGLSGNKTTLQIGQKIEVITDSPGRSGGYTQGRSRIIYTVKKGDTLGKIAPAYGVTVESIQRWNNKKDTRLQIGDRLAIYTDRSGAEDVVAERTVVHRVKSGETMSGIAESYGTSVGAIKLENNKSSDRIKVGEELTIRTNRAESGSAFVHKVTAGETLSGIAQHYGVSTSQIKSWNGKRNNDIDAGEKLTIRGVSEFPASSLSGKPKLVLHKVESGETLSRIAVQHGVSVDEIVSWNDKDSDNINIGEVLSIYSTRSKEGFNSHGTQPVTHEVKKGETLWAIAQRYGTTTDAILRDNESINPKRLHIGDILLVNVNNR